MNGYYFLHLLDVDGVPVAYGTDDPQRDEAIAEPGRVADWTPVRLVCGGQPTDYLPNNIGVRLCSARLRHVLDRHRAPSDDLQWLDATVSDPSGREHPYFVLHIPTHPDVLDSGRSIWVGKDFVVKPVISLRKAGERRVFSFPGSSIRLLIANEIKEAIERDGLTGVDFSPVPSV